VSFARRCTAGQWPGGGRLRRRPRTGAAPLPPRARLRRSTAPRSASTSRRELWTVPFVGTGVYTDTLGTLIILPFVTTLLCTIGVRRAALPRLPQTVPVLDLLPEPLLLRAVAFSVLTVCSLAAPFAAVLALAAPDGLGADAFVAYKTALGVGLGFVVTPLVALRAML
jgi:hypothetical protein